MRPTITPPLEHETALATTRPVRMATVRFTEDRPGRPSIGSGAAETVAFRNRHPPGSIERGPGPLRGSIGVGTMAGTPELFLCTLCIYKGYCARGSTVPGTLSATACKTITVVRLDQRQTRGTDHPSFVGSNIFRAADHGFEVRSLEPRDYKAFATEATHAEHATHRSKPTSGTCS
jgi:hypothetical protein